MAHECKRCDQWQENHTKIVAMKNDEISHLKLECTVLRQHNQDLVNDVGRLTTERTQCQEQIKRMYAREVSLKDENRGLRIDLDRTNIDCNESLKAMAEERERQKKYTQSLIDLNGRRTEQIKQLQEERDGFEKTLQDQYKINDWMGSLMQGKPYWLVDRGGELTLLGFENKDHAETYAKWSPDAKMPPFQVRTVMEAELHLHDLLDNLQKGFEVGKGPDWAWLMEQSTGDCKPPVYSETAQSFKDTVTCWYNMEPDENGIIKDEVGSAHLCASDACRFGWPKSPDPLWIPLTELGEHWFSINLPVYFADVPFHSEAVYQGSAWDHIPFAFCWVDSSQPETVAKQRDEAITLLQEIQAAYEAGSYSCQGKVACITPEMYQRVKEAAK